MLILLNKRWKSGSCLLLACQTMANKHSFPWLELFITVWILECNYALYLSCIIHTIIIPQLNYLFITKGDICSVSWEDFFFFWWCLSLPCPSSRWNILEEPLALSPWLVCWQFGQTFSHIYSCCWRKMLGKRNFKVINVWECLQCFQSFPGKDFLFLLLSSYEIWFGIIFENSFL